jgi:hypothetical protein
VYDTNTSTAKGECMHSEEEYNQAMLERQQMLEEALERAETGVATEDDWNTIRFECGVSRRPKSTETRSE